MNPNDNITWIELICKKTNSSYPETLRGKETLISIEGKKYLIRSNEDSIPFCEKIDGECWLFAKNLNVYGELIKEGYIPASSFGISEKETTQIIKVRKNPQDRKIPLILFKSTTQKNLTNPEDEKVYFPKEIPNEKNSSDENFPNFQFQKIESFINSEQTENSEKIQQFNKKNESSQNSNSETENMSNYEFHEESHDQLHEKVLEQKAKVADLKKRIMNTRNAEIMELPLLTKIAKKNAVCKNLIDDKNS
ncbi:hypothetical protein M0811_08718 [Anaeramoeba ignava]|uniref:Uncharacterized protein n=1 Tax=Anaeramoeba ignava TaxID=1746090 RepID=A0A9Q0LLG1_ANAIG|nr:hypothetical protein M0811_08718 [Anaeramoeba ignava]